MISKIIHNAWKRKFFNKLIHRNGRKSNQQIELNQERVYNSNLYTTIDIYELFDILQSEDIQHIGPKPYIKKEYDKLTISKIRIGVPIGITDDIRVKIEFHLCSFAGFEMIGCKVHSSLKFDSCFVESHIDIFSTTFEGDLEIKATNVRRLRIQDCTFSALHINGGNVRPQGIPNFNIINCKFETLSVRHYHFPFNLWISHLSNHGRIEISRINALVFGLSDIANERWIFIEDVRSTVFSFNRFYNYGVLKLNGVSAASIGATVSLINFQSVYFSKAELLFVDFDSFDFHNVFSCRLQEVSFISCWWNPEIWSIKDEGIATGFAENNMTLYQKPLIEKEKAHERIRNWWKRENMKNERYSFMEQENFRQLKHAAASTGDMILQRYFYNREMTRYIRALSGWSGISTKLILIVSNICSKYGQSLLRPVLTLALINLPIFLYLVDGVPSSEIRVVPVTQHDWDACVVAFGKFIQFLNPVHEKIKDFNGKDVQGGYYLLDLLARVVSSYSIYNLLRATRRFIDK